MPATNLSAINLECTRNNHVLFSKVNFSVNSGTLVHFCGENGIGKTTLLRCVAGLFKPYSGQIQWQEINIQDHERYKEQILFIGHKIAVKSSLSVLENLRYSAVLRCKPTYRAINTVLEKMGLSAKKNLKAGYLSSGQKQRLALSNLLLVEAKIWILDEPFTSLDDQGCQLIESLMFEHIARQGIILLTSHRDLKMRVNDYRLIKLMPFLGQQLKL